MRFTHFLFPLLGLVLLAVVVSQADVADLIAHIESLGSATAVLILGLYVLYFAADVANWQAVSPAVPRTLRWFAELYVVRMIGDAYNNITPTASVGGEPVKAWLLKRKYGIPYRDSGASLVIARTCTMFALVLFAAIGIGLLLRRPGLNAAEQGIALASLVMVVAGTAAIFFVQYFKLSTRVARSLVTTHWGAGLRHLLRAIEDIDSKFIIYYAQHRLALGISIAAAFAAWVLGAVEACIVLRALGYPATFTDIWIMEAFVQIVRAGTFFIPGALGTQEAATYMMVQWLFGAPSVGVATAVIRRGRELVWISVSLLVATAYALGPRQAARIRIEVD